MLVASPRILLAMKVLAVAGEVYGDRLDPAARFFVQELFGG